MSPNPRSISLITALRDMSQRLNFTTTRPAHSVFLRPTSSHPTTGWNRVCSYGESFAKVPSRVPEGPIGYPGMHRFDFTCSLQLKAVDFFMQTSCVNFPNIL